MPTKRQAKKEVRVQVTLEGELAEQFERYQKEEAIKMVGTAARQIITRFLRDYVPRHGWTQ